LENSHILGIIFSSHAGRVSLHFPACIYKGIEMRMFDRRSVRERLINNVRRRSNRDILHFILLSLAVVVVSMSFFGPGPCVNLRVSTFPGGPVFVPYRD